MSKIKDMMGMRFGKLRVIMRDHTQPHDGAYWQCQCDCGNQIVARGARLRAGQTNCGCARGKRMDVVDTIIGRRFGRLTVLELNPGRQAKIKYYKCQCDCGRITDAAYSNLIQKSIQSCGCLLEERKQAWTLEHRRRLWGFPFKSQRKQP